MRGTAGSNFALARRLQETLGALRVNDLAAGVIVRRYLTIGQAVRGPDDQGVD